MAFLFNINVVIINLNFLIKKKPVIPALIFSKFNNNRIHNSVN